jgi:hypothetical protein
MQNKDFSSACFGERSFNDGRAGDANPDSADVYGEWAHADANVNGVVLPEHHDGADGARRERGYAHVRERGADVRARVVRQDASKDLSPLAIPPAAIEVSAARGAAEARQRHR